MARILIVEDVVDVALTLGQLCKSWGHDARIAYDGPMALEEVGDFPPELILLDLGLPGLSGIDVAAEIRKSSAQLRAPVIIFVTGYDTAIHRNLAKKAGAQHYLTKPVDVERLKKLVDGHLNSTQPA